MDKVHKVTDPQQAETSGAQCTTTTNWEKCVVCQETTQEVLHCPADLKHDRVGPGYTTLANNLMGFSNIGCLPKTIQLSRLDDGDGIETTFQHHKAKWHDSCRLKFNKSKLQRAEKRKASAEEKTSPLKKYTRQSKGQTLDFTATCFFCGEIGSGKSLHQASTFELDIRVRQCALKLQDKPLLAKLSAGDLIAQEAKYHTKCLISLYNKARDVKSDQLDINDINHGIAFAGLVSYIEEANADSTVAPMFKMADLSKLYIARLEQLGTVVSGRVHSTHLKDRILAYFPDMEAHSQGRDVVLVSKQDINSALRKACDYDADNDAVHLARAANIVRKDMFKMKTTFNGTFDPMCQKQSVPISLLSLVSMILNGPNIKDQSSYTSVPQSVISLSQLLMFNSYVRHRESPTATTAARHSQQRETPLPVYLGVMVHTKTRKRELVDTLFNLGLSISYDRVLKISTELGNNICQYYEIENAVCPPQLRGNLFTTSAIDNIDHNPSSTSAHDSFHGTGISLFQHPSNDASGVQRSVWTNPDNSDNSTKKTLSLLPESYTRVPPVAFIRQDQPVPKLDGPNKADCQLIPQAMQMEYRWLDQVRRVVTDGTLQEDETVSWAAYQGSQQPLNSTSDNSVTLTSLLPLFYDQAKSVAMIRHSIDVVKSAVDILNPGQVPIITVDQPLYTLAKQIQWTWPTIYGEDQIVVMFGGLHIEMAVLKVLGDLLEDSGWTSALTQAGIASSGTADSFQKASHVTRCRRAHQVTASSLYILMQRSYTQYSSSLEDGGNPLPFQDWCRDRAVTCPQFQFWYIILHLELAMLIYIRAIREANFRLYVEALTMITPWFFALDHTNYARWIPVHLRDMVTLELKHPSVFAEFLNGNFTVKKTARVFSTIAIDQAHEQNNATIKGDGGAVGLTKSLQLCADGWFVVRKWPA